MLNTNSPFRLTYICQNNLKLKVVKRKQLVYFRTESKPVLKCSFIHSSVYIQHAPQNLYIFDV